MKFKGISVIKSGLVCTKDFSDYRTFFDYVDVNLKNCKIYWGDVVKSFKIDQRFSVENRIMISDFMHQGELHRQVLENNIFLVDRRYNKIIGVEHNYDGIDVRKLLYDKLLENNDKLKADKLFEYYCIDQLSYPNCIVRTVKLEYEYSVKYENSVEPQRRDVSEMFSQYLNMINF